MIEGPMVEDICIFFINSPFDEDGFAFVNKAMTSSKLSASFAS